MKFPLTADTEHLPNSNISRTATETQGQSAWAEPRGALGELVRLARERARTVDIPEAAPGPQAASFSRSLAGGTVSIIAEIKRSSPSRGPINAGIDASSQAAAFENGGASAISVLTEPSRFGGSMDDLRRVRRASGLPLLRKDFLVAPSQLAETRSAGASAALIIVRAVHDSLLMELSAAGVELGVELLFEVRDERELERAMRANAQIVGVNNRNLETLEVDSTTVSRIVPLVPPECLAVAESGYMTRQDVEAAAAAGADAVLIGSALSLSSDPEAALREMMGISRASRV